MKIYVKTTGDKIYPVQVTLNNTFAYVKQLVQEQDSTVGAEAHRLIYQGRILDDQETVTSAKVGENHTLLIVPVASGQRSSVDASGQAVTGQTGQQTASDLAALLASGAYSFPVRFQRHLRGASHSGLLDEEMGLAALTEFREGGREGDNMDLLLGIGVGFLLGCVAGLCLIETGLSRRLKLGVLLGITCNVSFALLRLSLVSFRGDRLSAL